MSAIGLREQRAEKHTSLERFDDREDAVATLREVMDEEGEASWMLLRYSLRKGGGGLEEGSTKRDLTCLEVDAVGVGPPAAIHAALPPDEVAFVLYNAVKGNAAEDRTRTAQRKRTGAVWKRWMRLRERQAARHAAAQLAAWRAFVDQREAEEECARLRRALRAAEALGPLLRSAGLDGEVIPCPCLASARASRAYLL